jgi:hypothetical protein
VPGVAQVTAPARVARSTHGGRSTRWSDQEHNEGSQRQLSAPGAVCSLRDHTRSALTARDDALTLQGEPARLLAVTGASVVRVVTTHYAIRVFFLTLNTPVTAVTRDTRARRARVSRLYKLHLQLTCYSTRVVVYSSNPGTRRAGIC